MKSYAEFRDAILDAGDVLRAVAGGISGDNVASLAKGVLSRFPTEKDLDETIGGSMASIHADFRIYHAIVWRGLPTDPATGRPIDLSVISGAAYVTNEGQVWRPRYHPGGGQPDRIDRDRLTAWARRQPVPGSATCLKSHDGTPFSFFIQSIDIEQLVTSTYSAIQQPVMDQNYNITGYRSLDAAEVADNCEYLRGHLQALRDAAPLVEVVNYGGCPAGPAYYPIVSGNSVQLAQWRAGNDFGMQRCWHVLDTVGVSIYTPTRDAPGANWRRYADGMLAEARRVADYGGKRRRVYAYVRPAFASDPYELLPPGEFRGQLQYLAQHSNRPTGVIVWDWSPAWVDGHWGVLQDIRSVVDSI